MSCYEVVTSTPARPSTCPSQEQGSHETGEAPAPGTRHVPESKDRLRLGQDMGPWVALALWGHGWAGQGRAVEPETGPTALQGSNGIGERAPGKGVNNSQA